MTHEYCETQLVIFRVHTGPSFGEFGSLSLSLCLETLSRCWIGEVFSSECDNNRTSKFLSRVCTQVHIALDAGLGNRVVTELQQLSRRGGAVLCDTLRHLTSALTVTKTCTANLQPGWQGKGPVSSCSPMITQEKVQASQILGATFSHSSAGPREGT